MLERAIAINDFGTAHRMLVEVWNTQKRPEAARLLAKLNFEKLDNNQVAFEWLRKLAAENDRRARLELVLLAREASERAVVDADSRFAGGIGADGTGIPTAVGTGLSKLAEDPIADREAVYACIFHHMDQPDTDDRNRDRDDRNRDRPCSKATINKIKELKDRGDPLASVIELRRESGVEQVIPDTAIAAAVAGGFHAALSFLESTPLKSDSDVANFKKISDVIERTRLRDDKFYIASEALFRIVDNRPTQGELIRADLLLALANLTGKSKVASGEQLTRGKQLIAKADQLFKVEGQTGERQHLPYRLFS
jgi:hypothetical protein